MKLDSEEKDLVIKELQEELQRVIADNEHLTGEIECSVESQNDEDFCVEEVEIENVQGERIEDTCPVEEIMELTSEPTQEELDRTELELGQDVVLVYDRGFFRNVIGFLGIVILMIFIALLIIIFVKIIYMEV